MIAWIKKRLGITALEEQNKLLDHKVNHYRELFRQQVAELKDYTRVDADVGIRGNNTIVLTGVYRRQAFVRFYDLGDGEFQRLVEQLRGMREHSLIRHIDAPPNFHGMFDL